MRRAAARSFRDAAAAETLLKPELVKRDLGHVLQKLEELQEARLKAEAAPKKAEPDMPGRALGEGARVPARSAACGT